MHTSSPSVCVYHYKDGLKNLKAAIKRACESCDTKRMTTRRKAGMEGQSYTI